MTAPIALICVTRSRPQALAELLKLWKGTTTGNSDLIFAIDDDQRDLYSNDPIGRQIAHNQHPGCYFHVRPRKRMIPRLDETAVELAKSYPYIGFIGDDHHLRTWGWELMVITAMKAQKDWGIVYGDDKLMGEKLATAAFLSSKVINTLGWICPPGFIHLCMDACWMELGQGAGILKYLPGMVIEHMHWSNGKSEKDAAYDSLNDTISPDMTRYGEWMTKERDRDVARLKAAVGAGL